jgi:hypothetical protein
VPFGIGYLFTRLFAGVGFVGSYRESSYAISPFEVGYFNAIAQVADKHDFI